MSTAGAIPVALAGCLLTTPALSAQGRAPDPRSCTPTAFAEQSAIPVLAAYIDAAEGLAIGRGGSGAPFVASLQGSVMWSPVASARRWALGPVAGFSYANPRVHGLLGGRVRYRALPLRIHDQMDLGLGVDVFTDVLWETPSTALIGLGGSADLPLDLVVPFLHAPRLLLRIARDAHRDDWRLELGLGTRLDRRLPTNPRTPEEPERWAPVISSIQGAIEEAVIIDSTVSATPILCDYAMLRAADSVLSRLRADAARAGSTIDADTIPARFSAAGLDSIVVQLDHPANTWRQQLADSLRRPPPATVASAIVVIAGRVRAALDRRYRLGQRP
jgi:hypothetical protein